MNDKVTTIGTLLTVGGATAGLVSPEEVHSIGAIIIGIITSVLQLVSMFKKKGGNNG